MQLCPRCKARLKRRKNKTTGNRFWGCSQWRPDGKGCDYTRNMTAVEADEAAQIEYEIEQYQDAMSLFEGDDDLAQGLRHACGIDF